MQKIFLTLLSLCFLLAACNLGGNKININNKSEVYYKGDDVSKGDAQKLGNFLERQNFFNTVNKLFDLYESVFSILTVYFNKDVFFTSFIIVVQKSS